MRTFNRRPIDVRTNYANNSRYFNQMKFTGIKENQNIFDVDQYSLIDANNIYVNEENTLVSRPPLALTNLPSEIQGELLETAYINNINIYVVKNNDTYTAYAIGKEQTAEIAISSTYKLTLYNQYVIIWNLDGAKVLDTDFPILRWTSLNDYIEIPITKTVAGSDIQIRPGNILTNSHITKYIETKDTGTILPDESDSLTPPTKYRYNIHTQHTNVNDIYIQDPWLYTDSKLLKEVIKPVKSKDKLIVRAHDNVLAIMNTKTASIQLSLDYGQTFTTIQGFKKYAIGHFGISQDNAAIIYTSIGPYSANPKYESYHVYRYTIGTKTWTEFETRYAQGAQTNWSSNSYCYLSNDTFAFIGLGLNHVQTVYFLTPYSTSSTLNEHAINVGGDEDIPSVINITVTANDLLITVVSAVGYDDTSTNINLIHIDKASSKYSYESIRNDSMKLNSPNDAYMEISKVSINKYIHAESPKYDILEVIINMYYNKYKSASDSIYSNTIKLIRTSADAKDITLQYTENEVAKGRTLQTQAGHERLGLTMFARDNSFIGITDVIEAGLSEPAGSLLCEILDDTSLLLQDQQHVYSPISLRNIEVPEYIIPVNRGYYIITLAIENDTNIYHIYSNILNADEVFDIDYIYIDKDSEFKQVPNVTYSGTQLFLAFDNKLLITKNIKENNNILFNLPEDLSYPFVDTITNIINISTTEIAIFFTNNILICKPVQDEVIGLTYDFLKTRLSLGVRLGDDVINTLTGQYSLFPTVRGLAMMNYQAYMATSDQIVNYVSDDIQEIWNKFYSVNKPIKLLQMRDYVFITNNTNKILMLDMRNMSWWKFEIPFIITRLFTDQIKLSLISKKLYYFDTNYHINNYRDIDNQPINWKITSQRLHFNLPNHYKNIKQLVFQLIQTSDFKHNILATLKVYRKVIDYREPELISFNIDEFNTFVKRFNYWKVNELQYTLANDDEIANPSQLKVNGLSVKYEIGEEVR